MSKDHGIIQSIRLYQLRNRQRLDTIGTEVVAAAMSASNFVAICLLLVVATAERVVVSPRNLTSVVGRAASSSLVVFFASNLPRWETFSLELDQLEAKFSDQPLQIVMANVTAFKKFKSQHGLHQFPTVYVYPKGRASRFPIDIGVQLNSTAATLAPAIQHSLDIVSGVPQDMLYLLDDTRQWLADEAKANLQLAIDDRKQANEYEEAGVSAENKEATVEAGGELAIDSVTGDSATASHETDRLAALRTAAEVHLASLQARAKSAEYFVEVRSTAGLSAPRHYYRDSQLRGLRPTSALG